MTGRTIDESLFCKESSIGLQSSLYYRCAVDHSTVSNNCVVGDFSRIIHSTLHSFVKVDRNNLIYHSVIGEYSYTGMFDMIFHAQIGKFCSIAYGTVIGPADHNYNKISSHPFLYDSSYLLNNEECLLKDTVFDKELLIENDVWIGCNATILRGVKIGNGAVVGANALVNKDVPPYAVVAGNPARIIKYRFSEQVIVKLLELKWWHWSIEKIRRNHSLFAADNIEKALMNVAD